MTTFVLVSGAWHAGWCWERIVPLLEARGHRAIAPDLLGMGSDSTPLSDVTPGKWADQIAEVIREQGEPVVLVGHSRGGIVISLTAERVPERISSLAYLAAYLVPPGETMLSTSAQHYREGAGDILVSKDDGTVEVQPDAVGPTFYNMTEPAWVDRAVSLMTPEPMMVFGTPLDLSEAAYGSVKRAYIECTKDNAVPLALQRIMQERQPCDPVFTLETDHSPFYSAPDLLTDYLARLG